MRDKTEEQVNITWKHDTSQIVPGVGMGIESGQLAMMTKGQKHLACCSKDPVICHMHLQPFSCRHSALLHYWPCGCHPIGQRRIEIDTSIYSDDE